MQTTKPPTAPLAYVVTRPFFLAGEVQAIGARVELAPPLGRELETAGKVAPAPAEQPAPSKAKKA